MNTLQDEITYQKNAGRMKQNLILVDSHALDIPQKLQVVDPALFVMYNPAIDKYEIHRRGMKNTLELNLPYRELDNRAIIAFNNAMDEKLLEKIETENEKIQTDKDSKSNDEMSQKLGDIHTYCRRHADKEYVDKGAFKTRFV